MKTTAIYIKTDQEVKERAQKMAEELGLSLSAVLTASLKQFIRTGEVQFSIAPKMTPYLEDRIEKVRRDYKLGKNISGPFENVDELMKDLLS